MPAADADDPAAPPTTRDALRHRVPRSAGDVRVHALADGVWTLTLPLPYPRPRSVNAYLLQLADGVCLVDCGSSLAPGWDALVVALAGAGYAPADVRLLVCTHLHPDHAGLAATVRERTSCDVVRGRGPDSAQDVLRDFGLPIATRRRHAVRAGAPAGAVAGLVDANVAGEGDHERVVPDRLLDPGDEIRAVAGAWTVVPVPGHSSNQVALFEPARRWLISADLAYAGGDPYTEFGPTLDPVADHLASLGRALRLEPERLLPGHGRPIDSATGVRAVLTDAQEATRRVVDRARTTLRSGDRTAYAVALELVDHDPDLDRFQAAVSTALCALDHLVLRGEATVRTEEDGVRRYGGNVATHARMPSSTPGSARKPTSLDRGRVEPP